MRTLALTLAVLLGTAVGLALIDSTSALAQGGKDCSQLSNRDFERAGEAWMQRMLRSSQAHESMDRLMGSMMGPAAEQQMHVYMGRRATGCGGGTVPPGFGRMMGVIGMMGGAGSVAPGMMGGGGFGYGPGSMMGGYPIPRDSGDNDDGGPSAAAMVGMMGVLIAAAAIALAIFRPWRGGRRGSLETLDRRLAAGELSPEEYRQAKSLLEGGGR